MSENGEVEDDGSVEITLEDTESTEIPVVKKVEASSGDTDLQDHSESVRKRIDKLTYRVREAERREQAAPPPRVEQQAPRPDPKAQSWAERNEWFGSDKAMTATAYAIHADLVEAEGFDPTSDDYYQELDSRIRNEFPHKFKTSQGNNRPQSAVASARTTVKSSSNKVKLTESQIRVAKSLGVSLEEYARHARIQQQG